MEPLSICWVGGGCAWVAFDFVGLGGGRRPRGDAAVADAGVEGGDAGLEVAQLCRSRRLLA